MRTLLILAANPKGTERLRLDEEVKKIEQGLERAKRRDQFKLVVKWAVTDDDLRRAMLDNEPEFVHFSGQGGGSQGLAFVDSQGRLLVISGDSLARLFELCADHVRCVILNACFSEVQAKVISRHIEIVVGMSQDIGEEASIKFSEGFNMTPWGRVGPPRRRSSSVGVRSTCGASRSTLSRSSCETLKSEGSQGRPPRVTAR